METVQLTINDARYAAALREMLERNGTRKVECVEVPDPRREGVIVVDPEGLDRLPSPVLNPERVVLITRNDPQHLSQAWNAGIRSVVFSGDPLSTAVLAIMAAELRVPKPDPRWSLPHPPGPPGSAPAGTHQANPAGERAQGRWPRGAQPSTQSDDFGHPRAGENGEFPGSPKPTERRG